MSEVTVDDRLENDFETPVTFALAGLLVLVYVLHVFVDARYGEETLRYLFYVQSTDLERVWTWVTSPVGHVNEVHLAVNTMFLLLFGGSIEREYGGRVLAGVFFLTGVFTAPLGTVFGGAVHCGPTAWLDSCSVAAAGSSMALFGLVGFATGVRPRGEVYLFPTSISVPMWGFSAFFVVLSLLAMFASFDPLAAVLGFYPGHEYHLIGLAVGGILGLARSRRR